MIRKLIIGKTATFRWSPPSPDIYATAASLSIFWPAGTQSYALTKRAGDTVASISTTDRRRVTVEWGVDGALTTFPGGLPEPAWMQTGGEVQVPVRVTRVVSTTAGPPAGGVLELAEPLPTSFSGDAALEWQTFTCQITSAHVSATMTRAVRWRVLYTPVVGGGADNDLYDHGTLAVVNIPFATGLTDGYLAGIAAWTQNARPVGQSSWAPQIAIGLDRLCGILAPELPADRWEDHLTGEPWRRAHALATILTILEAQQQQGQDRGAAIERAEQELEAEVKRRLARIEWLDDGDATVETGETDAQPGRLTLASHVSDTAIWDRADTDDETPDPWTRVRVTDPR